MEPSILNYLPPGWSSFCQQNAPLLECHAPNGKLISILTIEASVWTQPPPSPSQSRLLVPIPSPIDDPNSRNCPRLKRLTRNQNRVQFVPNFDVGGLTQQTHTHTQTLTGCVWCPGGGCGGTGGYWTWQHKPRPPTLFCHPLLEVVEGGLDLGRISLVVFRGWKLAKRATCCRRVWTFLVRVFLFLN